MSLAEVVNIVNTVDKPHRRFVVAGLCPMFGMLLASCTAGKIGAPTTMITGHLTTLAMGLVKACMEGGLMGAERSKIILSGLVTIFTLAGAVMGVVAIQWHTGKHPVLLLPVAPCMAILLWCYDHLAKPRSLVKGTQKRIRASARGLDMPASS